MGFMENEILLIRKIIDEKKLILIGLNTVRVLKFENDN